MKKSRPWLLLMLLALMGLWQSQSIQSTWQAPEASGAPPQTEEGAAASEEAKLVGLQVIQGQSADPQDKPQASQSDQSGSGDPFGSRKDLDLSGYFRQFNAGGTFPGNYLHLLQLNLEQVCRPHARLLDTARKFHTGSKQAIESVAWSENYQKRYCADYHRQPHGFISWALSATELWEFVVTEKSIRNFAWWMEYAEEYPDMIGNRQHMHVTQPSYAALKEAEAAILYAADVARIELGLLVYGDYHPSLGDPLAVPIDSAEFPAVEERYSMRQMELTAMVFYCRFRSEECGPGGFYSFIQCRFRYICSDSFSVFNLFTDRYHPRELAFANAFVDAILRERKALGSVTPR